MTQNKTTDSTFTSINYIAFIFLAFNRQFKQSRAESSAQRPNSGNLAVVGLEPATFSLLFQYLKCRATATNKRDIKTLPTEPQKFYQVWMMYVQVCAI